MKKFIYGKNSEVLKLREWHFEGIECENFVSRTSAEDAAKYLLAHSLYYDDCQSGEYMLDVVPIEDPEVNQKCTEYFVKMLHNDKIIAVFFADNTDGWHKRAILDSIAFGFIK